MSKRIHILSWLVIFGCIVANAENEQYTLSFFHTHTNERLTIGYRADGKYLHQELEKLNHFLRDFRAEEQISIDVALLEALYLLKRTSNSNGVIEIISAYRSPTTNEMLRKTTLGVAKSSLHVQGRAMDIRLSDVNTRTLRNIARSLQLGGVGYYPGSNFIHIDTGRVRAW